MSVVSNSYAGYRVSVQASENYDNKLRPRTDTGAVDSSNNNVIDATSRNVASPGVLASDKTWGIAIPGRQGYSSEDDYKLGISAADSNQEVLQNTTYGAVPNYGSPTEIITGSGPSGSANDGKSADQQNMYYGVRIDSPQLTQAGTYSTNVTYTATVVLPQEATLTSLSPVSYAVGQGSANTLTLTGTNLASAYSVFVDFDGDGTMDSGEQCEIVTTSDTQITCNAPTSYSGKTATFDVYVQTQAKDTPTKLDSTSGGLTYINSVCRSGDSNSDCAVEIDDNMIPVKYTGTTSVAEWTSIDNPEDASNPGEWYDYRSQKWANAVTVKDEALSKYKGKEVAIDEDDVKGYWVYIPRYSYEVMRLNATDKYVDNSDFTIIFERVGDANSPKKTPANSCNSTTQTATTMWKDGVANNTVNNIAVNDYRTGCGLDRSYPGNNDSNIAKANGGTTWATHPAFTFGVTELDGFWVGKYELTGSRTNPTVLPNQFANISETIGSFYDTIKAIGQPDANNSAGGGSNRGENLHNLASYKSSMIKNDQWGAVAYLSASQYGAGVNKVYNNSARVWYYKDNNGLLQMAKDADGNNVDQCYYNKKSYDTNTGTIVTTGTSIGCFRNASGEVVTSNGVTMNTKYQYTYTSDANGTQTTETTSVGHWGGNHTGCGPYNASGSTTAYDFCEANGDRSYQSQIGQLASTTNNVYGVYDMAGANWEYVAANLTSYDDTTQTNSTSYLTKQGDDTYFNLFRTSDGFDRTTAYGTNGVGKAPAWSVKYGGANSTNIQPWRVYMYNNDFCTWDSCGGQALHETKRYQSVNDWARSWGGDNSHLSNVTDPWLRRGGRIVNGTDAGVFASAYGYGSAYVYAGSRAVLAGR